MKSALAAARLPASSPGVAAWNDPNVEGTRAYHPRVHVFDDDDSAKMRIESKAEGDDPAVFEAVEGTVIRCQFEHRPTTSVPEIVRSDGNGLRSKGFEPIIAGRVTKYPALQPQPRGHDRLLAPGRAGQGHDPCVAARLSQRRPRLAAVGTDDCQDTVDAARPGSAGLGDARPVTGTATEEARARNRRVERVRR